MKTEFKDSFLKDIRAVKDKKLRSRLEQFILAVETADNLQPVALLSSTARELILCLIFKVRLNGLTV